MKWKKNSHWLYPLLAVGVFIILLAVQTFPLLQRIGTDIPGPESEDPAIYLWNAWWFSEAVTSPDKDLYYTQDILYPYGLSMGFQTHTYIHDALTFVVTPLVGFIAAFNVVMLLSILAGALGAYYLAYAHTRRFGPSLFAGVIFGFSPFIFERLQGHYDLVAIWPIPWFFYCLTRFAQTKKLRFAIGSGSIFGLAVLNGVNYPLFILIATAVLGTVYMIQNRKTVVTKKMFLYASLGIIVASSISFPLLRAYIAAYSPSLITARSPEDIYSASLGDYLRPSNTLSMYQDAAPSVIFPDVNIERRVFLTFGVVVLLLFLFWFTYAQRHTYQKREVRAGMLPWVVLLVVSFVLSLGPDISIGSMTIPMPYQLFYYLPILEGLRAAGRFGLLVMLAASVLSAYALVALENAMWRRSQRFAVWVVPFFLFLFVLESCIAPLKTTQVFEEPFPVEVLSSSGALLNIPAGIQDGRFHTGSYYFRSQVYQIQHQKPIVDGIASRIPSDLLYTASEKPGFRYVLNFDTGYFYAEDFNPALVRRTFLETGITDIVFHRSALSGSDERMLRSYVQEMLRARVVFEDRFFVIYRVDL